MQLNIDHFLIKRLNQATLVWGVVQIRDPWYNNEIGLYNAPDYLIFEGTCENLTYKVHHELSQWEIFDMLIEKSSDRFLVFNTWQINELDPDLEKQIEKLVMIAKLKM